MPATLHDTTEVPGAGVRPVRVMTADDQAIFREAARAVVECLPGFVLAAEAADGASALAAVRAVDPDVVILDVRMPDIDGIEVARRLTAEDPDRLVVLVTSADLHELSELARTSGASALVAKQWLTPRLLRGLWVAHRRR
jgi:DNA-binding NarL/FixJ family response regulator